jgi:ketosteroid isomerase-like protein
MYYMTSGQEFYERLGKAREAQDLAALSALYHSDAVSLSLSTGQVFRGRGAILDAFNQTFQIAGAISSRSVESMVEAEGAVCVEATLATRSREMQTYDIYMMQAGRVKQHVGGLISPRSPLGQRQGQGFPQTKGAALFHRLHAMSQARDFERLKSLYHPDAVTVNCSNNQALWGRDAIINSLKQLAQEGSSASRNSVEGFVENEEIICAEVSATCKKGTPVGPVQFDALMYEVYVLRAGQIRHHFTGLISPRWSELQQIIQQQIDLLIESQKQKNWIKGNVIGNLFRVPR